MNTWIVVAHLPLAANPDVLPADWMRGTKQQCDHKATVWGRYYRNVQVLKVAAS